MAWLKERLRRVRRQTIYPALGIRPSMAIRLFAPRNSRMRKLADIRADVSTGAVTEPLRHLLALGSRKNSERENLLAARLSEIRDVLDGRASEVFRRPERWTVDRRATAATDKPCILMNFNGSLPWQMSGYGIRSHMIVRHLEKLEFRVVAATRPGFPWDLPQFRGSRHVAAETVDQVNYHRLTADGVIRGSAPDSLYVRHYANALQRLAARHDPIVIHSASNYQNGMAGIQAAGAMGIASIYEMRGLWHYSRSARIPGFDRSERFEYEDAMERHAAASADHVIAISEALREHLVSKWGIDSAKISVVPNAVDVELFAPVERDHALRAKLKLSDHFVVGFVGSLTAYEGLEDLVKAVSMIEGNPRCGLVVVGDGPILSDLKDLARALGCVDRVKFVGRVKFSEVKRYYSCFDACAYPRKDLPVCRHVPPLKPLEAMAMGIPVVVSALRPLLEMVQGGVTGLKCEPGSPESLAAAIRELRDSADLRRRVGDNGQSWVRNERAWHSISGRYRVIYNAIAGNGVRSVA
jgi:glycosyltransferase involved in cell wall biosynthesis